MLKLYHCFWINSIFNIESHLKQVYVVNLNIKLNFDAPRLFFK